MKRGRRGESRDNRHSYDSGAGRHREGTRFGFPRDGRLGGRGFRFESADGQVNPTLTTGEGVFRVLLLPPGGLRIACGGGGLRGVDDCLAFVEYE